MKSRLSRRTFIGQTGAVGAGFWVAGRQLGYGQENSPNAKVNIACVGVDGRGAGHVDGLKGENLVALCDVDESRLDKQAAKFPKARKFVDFRKMLEEVKDIDAVSVATPDHCHAVVASMAMKLGKHVYVEKPMTHSIYEARTLTELAAKNPKLVTQMGNQGHSRDERRLLVEFLQQGGIGKVTQAHMWTNRPIWAQGLDRPQGGGEPPKGLHWDLWLGPAPERPYHKQYHPFSWRGWWDFGTGALGDMACHIMDAAYWGLKLGYPVEVSAEGDPLKPECGPKWMIVRQKYPSRGDLPAVDCTWYDGGKLPPPEVLKGVTVKTGQGDKQKAILDDGVVKVGNGNIFVGDKGSVFVPDEQSGGWMAILDGKTIPYAELKIEKTLPRVPGSMGGHFGEWVTGIKGGPRPLCEFAYAGPFTEMVLIGIAAFRSQKKLDWDGPTMQAKGAPEVDPYIKREYRAGWSL
jgi:predicted dehydrogenase